MVSGATVLTFRVQGSEEPEYDIETDEVSSITCLHVLPVEWTEDSTTIEPLRPSHVQDSKGRAFWTAELWTNCCQHVDLCALYLPLSFTRVEVRVLSLCVYPYISVTVSVSFFVFDSVYVTVTVSLSLPLSLYSARGPHHTFKVSANGYVWAEGCCVVFV